MQPCDLCNQSMLSSGWCHPLSRFKGRCTLWESCVCNFFCFHLPCLALSSVLIATRCLNDACLVIAVGHQAEGALGTYPHFMQGDSVLGVLWGLAAGGVDGGRVATRALSPGQLWAVAGTCGFWKGIENRMRCRTFAQYTDKCTGQSKCWACQLL